MAGFEYTPVITLGGILQIITMILGIGGAYVAIAQKDIQHDERIDFQSKETVRIERRVDSETVTTRRELEDINHNIQVLNEKISNYIISDLRNQVNKRDQTNARTLTR